MSIGAERRASESRPLMPASPSQLQTARDELAADEVREFHRQGVVIRVYLALSLVLSVGLALYFWSLIDDWALGDDLYRVCALLALGTALGMAVGLLLELRGRRTTAAVLSQVVPILPVLCYGAVFSVEAGFGSYLFIGALATVLLVPEDHHRTRISVVVALVVAVVIVQALFSRVNALAPLPPAETAALATFNRTVMTVALFALALMLNRSARIRRKLDRDSVALHRTEANTDELTGLPHRRPVWELVGERAEADAEFSLALVDIDHFKRLNDTHGHDRGDEALVRIARILRDSTRVGDLIGRWGGEEFVAVLHGGADEAHRAMERVATRIREGALPDGSTTEPLTVSIGIAVRESGEDPWGTLRRADRALYDAKRAGRDRVVLAPMSSSER